MSKFEVKQIGHVKADSNGFYIELEPQYIPALEGLEDFKYIQMVWWFDKCDNKISRNKLQEKKPYTNGPEVLGTFATRSPERPNPIALSCVYVTYIDSEKGIIGIAYTDAVDGSPVLDIKPYVASLDRIENVKSPKWCSNWPDCIEKSGEFDWNAEFTF